MDGAIISMAGDLEARVMATMLCKELGVKTVIGKCSSEMNCKILSKVGADRTVLPESESGVRLAKNLLTSGLIDLIELSPDVSMVELDVRPEWAGKSLRELDLRRKYGINVVAIMQDGAAHVTIDPEKPLQTSMQLVVIANTARLSKLV